jgi:hypothetical protein
MISKTFHPLAILAAVGLALSACAVQAPVAYPAPPPPPLAETVPLPPVSAEPLVWQPGHYDWNGSSYVWVAGTYVPRDGHGTLYQPGYWAPSPNGFVWVAAHWV